MEDLVGRVARRVYQRNGVITDIKSFGTVQLGYGIKKLDGRHYEVFSFFGLQVILSVFGCICEFVRLCVMLVFALIDKINCTLYW